MIVAHMIPSFIPEYERLPVGDKFSLAKKKHQLTVDHTSILVATVGKSHFTSDTSAHLSSIGHLACNDKNQYFLLVEYLLNENKNCVVSETRESNIKCAQHFGSQFQMT